MDGVAAGDAVEARGCRFGAPEIKGCVRVDSKNGRESLSGSEFPQSPGRLGAAIDISNVAQCSLQGFNSKASPSDCLQKNRKTARPNVAGRRPPAHTVAFISSAATIPTFPANSLNIINELFRIRGNS
jgi:hypothetical protein